MRCVLFEVVLMAGVCGKQKTVIFIERAARLLSVETLKIAAFIKTAPMSRQQKTKQFGIEDICRCIAGGSKVFFAY